MSLTELYPSVKELTRADKLRLMQFLVIDLAQDEGIPLLAAGLNIQFGHRLRLIQKNKYTDFNGFLE